MCPGSHGECLATPPETVIQSFAQAIGLMLELWPVWLLALCLIALSILHGAWEQWKKGGKK